MNTLQERMLEAIKNEQHYDGMNDHFYEDKTAESCAEISKLDAIAFAEWIQSKNATFFKGVWYIASQDINAERPFINTTEQLFSLYQTQQNG